MAETIKTGYLINKVPYKVFDEIISFIDKTGTIYNCMSLGSKRITSKNGRQLFYATPIEFEIFQSRFDNKLSKLKKAHALEEID
jgi:DNA repair protein RecO (recombination protein O)